MLFKAIAFDSCLSHLVLLLQFDQHRLIPNCNASRLGDQLEALPISLLLLLNIPLEQVNLLVSFYCCGLQLLFCLKQDRQFSHELRARCRIFLLHHSGFDQLELEHFFVSEGFVHLRGSHQQFFIYGLACGTARTCQLRSFHVQFYFFSGLILQRTESACGQSAGQFEVVVLFAAIHELTSNNNITGGRINSSTFGTHSEIAEDEGSEIMKLIQKTHRDTLHLFNIRSTALVIAIPRFFKNNYILIKLRGE